MGTEVKITHEAASQRQHLRLSLPIVATIDGVDYQVDNWSVGGLRVQGYFKPVEIGQVIPVSLRFAFEGFDMNFDTSLTVKHLDPSAGTFGAAFDEITPQRQSVLRYVIDAYLSCEVVDAVDVLQVIQLDNSARARAMQMPQQEMSKGKAFFWALRRNLGLTIIGLVALVLLGYIAVNLYTRTFIVSGDGAIVSPQGGVLRAPSSGVLVAFAVRPGDRVEPGAVLASLERPDGTVANLTSGCLCVVGERLAQLGENLSKAAPILSLAPVGAATRATLVVRLKDIRKVETGDRVAVSFFNDSSVAMGRVESVSLPGLTDPTTLERTGLQVPDLAGTVTVRFDKPIDVSRIGQPVSGRIRLYQFIPFT